MTYHRTAGKGGTRNAPAEPLPNFNKTQGSGQKRRGKNQRHSSPRTSGNYPPK